MKTLRNMVLAATIAFSALYSGCSGRVYRETFDKPVKPEDIQVYEKRITGQVLVDGRTLSGGYTISIKGDDGKVYTAGQPNESSLTRKVLGKSLYEIDNEINKGDIVSAVISDIGTKYSKPEFKDTTLVSIRKN